MTNEMKALQALRFKGRATAADLASATGLDKPAVEPLLAELRHANFCAELNGRHKLTKEGKAELETKIAAERSTLDQDALGVIYQDFCCLNNDFKQLVTDWQMKDESTPNAHDDFEYDNQIVDRLGMLHARFIPLLEQTVQSVPRLSHYRERFESALEKVKAGDHSWLARPLVDSYHTVWFELHEDLIGVTGLSRAEDAAAGRGQ